jgi:hypothetical protein
MSVLNLAAAKGNEMKLTPEQRVAIDAFYSASNDRYRETNELLPALVFQDWLFAAGIAHGRAEQKAADDEALQHWKRMYECAQNANSYRQSAIESQPSPSATITEEK